MNNIGLEIVFWTVLALYFLTKLGVFKKWKSGILDLMMNDIALHSSLYLDSKTHEKTIINIPFIRIDNTFSWGRRFPWGHSEK